MHTAGSLKGGQQVWALAKVKESFDVFGDDTVESFLLFSNPHMYGKSIDVRFTPVRVVCNNTLTMSLNANDKRVEKVSHRKAFDPQQAKEHLGIAHQKFEKYKEMAQFIGSRRYGAEELINFYNEVYPHTDSKRKVASVNSIDDLSRQARNCYDVLESQPGANYAEGSWWQAFNSVTYVTDHLQGRNAENRLHSQWFGANQNRKIKAAEKAVQYALAS